MEIVDSISIISILFLIVIVISTYLSIRNEWVSEILDDAIAKGGLKEFNKFPDYDTMLFKKFWVWNKEKLKKKN